MFRRRIRFIWGSSDAIKGEWRLGLWGVYVRDAISDTKGVAVSVRGLLRWLVLLALIGYLAAASALYLWFARKPYNQVTYTDTLLLPVRWTEVRESLGRAMIAEGLEDMKAQRWSEAHAKLRIGLARAPRERAARLELANFYLMAGQRDQALKVLTDGLNLGYPGRRYMEKLLPMALAGEDFELVNGICDRFIPVAEGDRGWLTGQKLIALIGLDRNEEVLALSTGESGIRRTDVRQARVTAMLNLGRAEEAAAYLREWESEQSRAAPAVLRLQLRAYRELKNFEEMDATIARFRALAPTDPAALISIVLELVMADRQAEASAALEQFFFRFGSQRRSMQQMAMALSETDATGLLERCAADAASRGFAAIDYQIALVQAKHRRNDWAGALATAAEMKLGPKARPIDEFVLTFFQRLATAAAVPDDAAQSGLVTLFQGRPLPMKTYRECVEVLLRAGRVATASQILGFASRSYEGSPTLTRLNEQTAAAMAELEAANQKRQQERVASDDPTETAQLERVSALRAAGKWSEVCQVIREIRVAKPAWLAKREPELLEWQTQAAARDGDTLEMLGAAKIFLDGSRDRSDRVLAMATELRETSADSADRLVAEVLRKIPGYPPAVRLHRQWHPEPAQP